MFRRILHNEFLKIATLVLLAVAVFALSLELPTLVTVEKDQTVAFPCQSRPCGCQNADDCWASCCCFSDSEKLAWANANHVTPPAWFMEKVQSEGIVASSKNSAQAQTCCCCHQAKETDNEDQGSETEPKLIRLTLKQHLGCQGQRELLKKQIVFVANAPFPTTPRPTNKFLRSPSATAITLFIDPPTPPPRRGSLTVV